MIDIVKEYQPFFCMQETTRTPQEYAMELQLLLLSRPIEISIHDRSLVDCVRSLFHHITEILLHKFYFILFYSWRR